MAAVVLAYLAQHPSDVGHVPGWVQLLPDGAQEYYRSGGDSLRVPAWVVCFMVVSILLAAVTLPSPVRPLRAREPGITRKTRPSIIGGLLLVVPSCVAFGVWSFEQYARNGDRFVNTSSSWAAVVWLTGTAAALVYLRSRAGPGAEQSRRTPPLLLWVLESTAVVCLIDIAAGLRVWQLGSVPEGVWFDEADFAGAAQHLMSMPFQPMGPGIIGEPPSLYFYVQGVLIDWAGASMGGVRLASALFGVLGVIGVYALGRQLGGIPFGVCAALLLAFSKWSIDFSRMGFAQIAAPGMTSVAMAVLCMAMLRPAAFWWALSGVLLGLAVLTYPGAFLAAGVAPLAVVTLRFAVDRRFRADAWPDVMLIPIGLVVGCLPFLVALHLDFNYVMSREQTVSLFHEYSRLSDQISHLMSNIRLHLLMFSVQGDANGRHNLPGTPTLDTTTGVLFLLGLGICARRLGQWFYQLMLLWLGASMLGGILSIDFEAPQTARSIGAVAPVALIAAMPLAVLANSIRKLITSWQLSTSDLKTVGRLVPATLPSVVASVALLIPMYVIARDNYSAYFVRQQADVAAWQDMGGLQAIIGRTALALQSEGYTVRIPPELVGGSQDDIALSLAAHGANFPAYDQAVPVPLPVPEPGLALIIPSDASDVLDYVERSYPTARTIPLTPRKDPQSVQATVVIITPQDAAGNVGITVAFGSGAGRTVQQHLTQPVSWPASAGPDTAVDFRGTLALSAQQTVFPVAFRVSGMTSGTMRIDGSTWPVSGGRSTPLLLLGAGNHSLEVSGRGKEAAQLAVEWQRGMAEWQAIPDQNLQSPDLPTGGLLGVYFASDDLTGQASFMRVDQYVNTYYQTPPSDLSFPFSVRWLGTVEAKSSGAYGFSLDSTGPAILLVDGSPVVDDGSAGGTGTGTVSLAAGVHAIRIEYRATGGYLHCYFKWRPPGQSGFEPVPPSVTLPAHQ